MKKKVAIFLYSLASGGAERVVSILLERLYKKYDITLFLMNDTIFYNIPKEIKIIFLEKSQPNENGFIKLLKLPILGWKYRNLLKQQNISLSLSLMTRPNYINLFAKIFGSKTKTIISERSHFSSQYNYADLQSFINKKLVKLYNFADLIIANADGNMYDLQENYHTKAKMTKIYNLIDINMINEKKKQPIDIKRERFIFITIGRLDSGKNHKLLLEAIKDIDADLWIIGDGELKNNLELIIDNLKLKDRVKLLGRQNNPYKFLDKADCFVFGSNHEGFPNVLLEALACGLPIISTDCQSGPREILAPDSDFSKQIKDIEYTKYGILVQINNVKKMTEAMQKILNDKQLRYNYAQKALTRAQEFDVKYLINKWEKVLDGKF